VRPAAFVDSVSLTTVGGTSAASVSTGVVVDAVLEFDAVAKEKFTEVSFRENTFVCV